MQEYLSRFHLPKNAADVTWAHAVNSQQLLKESLDGRAMMLEADVRRSSESGDIVLVHAPNSHSDLKFSDWVTSCVRAKRGIKLDFKDSTLVDACLDFMHSVPHIDQIPVWLSADLVQGPDGNPPQFEPTQFLNSCMRFLALHPNNVVLSAGWTIAPHGTKYLRDQLESQYKAVRKWPGYVSFALRLDLIQSSWADIQWMMKEFEKEPNGSRVSSLTVWRDHKLPLDRNGPIVWVRRNTDPKITFFDV